MIVEDLKKLIETAASTTEKTFGLGEPRILLILFLLLMAPTGARPGSLLKLRFGDIRVCLARDPAGGPHRVLVRFTLEFTKTCLGPKASREIPTPPPPPPP